MAAEKSDDDVVAVIIKCTNFAAIKHKNQRRQDPEKTPYINHPIGVAKILTEEGNVQDVEVIQAALLHDTVEDTDTSFDEIETEFGANVCQLVTEVTDNKSLPRDERKRLQIEHAAASTFGAKLIKLADKLYNLRDLERAPPESWTPERVQEYFEWAQKVVNGLRGTNKNIEDSLDEIFQRHCVSQ